MVGKLNLLRHPGELSQKYADKHIAVVNDAIVAIRKNRIEFYKKTTKNISPHKNVNLGSLLD